MFIDRLLNWRIDRPVEKRGFIDRVLDELAAIAYVPDGYRRAREPQRWPPKNRLQALKFAWTKRH